ncbi:sensor domain-containing diguanylate cyclase [Aliagarivorans marinus]|uniref:sensor domain-containing diguanylate cyclase n=1 Tax=Aliagarivorans marinus TaxID=561965 RepID=UPI00047BCB99|nr:diguanylate cyclase [Aliagarivorans marinus]
MTTSQEQLNEFHWMLDMVQTIDAGLVVLDQQYQVQIWNNFMEAHSGKRPDQTHGKSLFELFPELPADWLKQKIDSVFLLKNRAFTTWEQRPHVFPFRNYRPITGTVDFMYQNITLIPLTSLTGQVTHICIIVYDVTDSAVNKEEAQRVNEQLKALSRTDHLTSLSNRGYWQQRLEQEFGRSMRSGHNYALVMLDIDHFKNINDSYGHPVGDEIITMLADAIRHIMRKTDIAGRYGGEEFAVILTDCTGEAAMLFAERLREAVEQLKLSLDEQTITFTISLGVAALDGEMEAAADWLEAADKALYASKHQGRNRSTLYSQELE